MPSPDYSQQPIEQPLLAQALASTATAIFITDHAGKIVWVNDEFSRLSGYSMEDTIGHTPAILHSGKQGHDFYEERWQTILAGNVWHGEVVDQRKDGSLYVADEIVTPLFDEKGAIAHFVTVQHDITLQKQKNERDHHLAYHDVLTGLPNRANFIDVLQKAISHARRRQNMFATLFLDLDKFKPVNDTLGHQIGDQLLAAVAERLRAAVRQADIVARIGGDEFAILLSRLPDTEIAAALARKLVETLSRPFVLRGQKGNISASIGIAIYPADGRKPKTLLMKADKAMYLAKYHGGNDYKFYSETLFPTDKRVLRSTKAEDTSAIL